MGQTILWWIIGSLAFLWWTLLIFLLGCVGGTKPGSKPDSFIRLLWFWFFAGVIFFGGFAGAALWEALE